ncbi:MAG: 2Fe-2S iron-sulfur cluster binding domain-containing protein [Candidatus Marinimicrobia bacterium]|nr:2Fe-2S iron-sulfur cluster binding domain-containing protein [Candidatus Neomarinimicrobiota bacterium]
MESKKFSIRINDGERTFFAPAGESLLSVLFKNGILVPSACGGNGRCGFCRVKITDGAPDFTDSERSLISESDRLHRVHLSCQVRIESDLKIELPASTLNAKRFSGILEEKLLLTSDIVGLRIRLVNPEEIAFISGQYIQLRSPMYDGRESSIRAYSIASPPSDRNHVELNIRLVPNGLCSTWIFQHLQIGQKINLTGPYGDFHLSGSSAPAIFIAGGSGMAPFHSILHDLIGRKIRRDVAFFFGARTQADLFYVDELNRFMQENPWFQFIPALSNEPEDSDWKNERGLITDVVARYFPDCSKHEAYLCGSPGMIDSCLKVLTRNGMPKDKIYYDKFA